ncbi:unnamed protein product [Amoebophrya sp. A25]|nr:unnamed protein product [Amoebophrya sp. A25]|eukprot:GSA25T00000263001.1
MRRQFFSKQRRAVATISDYFRSIPVKMPLLMFSVFLAGTSPTVVHATKVAEVAGRRLLATPRNSSTTAGGLELKSALKRDTIPQKFTSSTNTPLNGDEEKTAEKDSPYKANESITETRRDQEHLQQAKSWPDFPDKSCGSGKSALRVRFSRFQSGNDRCQNSSCLDNLASDEDASDQPVPAEVHAYVLPALSSSSSSYSSEGEGNEDADSAHDEDEGDCSSPENREESDEDKGEYRQTHLGAENETRVPYTANAGTGYTQEVPYSTKDRTYGIESEGSTFPGVLEDDGNNLVEHDNFASKLQLPLYPATSFKKMQEQRRENAIEVDKSMAEEPEPDTDIDPSSVRDADAFESFSSHDMLEPVSEQDRKESNGVSISASIELQTGKLQTEEAGKRKRKSSRKKGRTMDITSHKEQVAQTLEAAKGKRFATAALEGTQPIVIASRQEKDPRGSADTAHSEKKGNNSSLENARNEKRDKFVEMTLTQEQDQGFNSKSKGGQGHRNPIFRKGGAAAGSKRPELSKKSPRSPNNRTHTHSGAEDDEGDAAFSEVLRAHVISAEDETLFRCLFRTSRELTSSTCSAVHSLAENWLTLCAAPAKFLQENIADEGDNLADAGAQLAWSFRFGRAGELWRKTVARRSHPDPKTSRFDVTCKIDDAERAAGSALEMTKAEESIDDDICSVSSNTTGRRTPNGSMPADSVEPSARGSPAATKSDDSTPRVNKNSSPVKSTMARKRERRLQQRGSQMSNKDVTEAQEADAALIRRYGDRCGFMAGILWLLLAAAASFGVGNLGPPGTGGGLADVTQANVQKWARLLLGMGDTDDSHGVGSPLPLSSATAYHFRYLPDFLPAYPAEEYTAALKLLSSTSSARNNMITFFPPKNLHAEQDKVEEKQQGDDENNPVVVDVNEIRQKSFRIVEADVNAAHDGLSGVQQEDLARRFRALSTSDNGEADTSATAASGNDEIEIRNLTVTSMISKSLDIDTQQQPPAWMTHPDVPSQGRGGSANSDEAKTSGLSLSQPAHLQADAKEKVPSTSTQQNELLTVEDEEHQHLLHGNKEDSTTVDSDSASCQFPAPPAVGMIEKSILLSNERWQTRDDIPADILPFVRRAKDWGLHSPFWSVSPPQCEIEDPKTVDIEDSDMILVAASGKRRSPWVGLFSTANLFDKSLMLTQNGYEHVVAVHPTADRMLPLFVLDTDVPTCAPKKPESGLLDSVETCSKALRVETSDDLEAKWRIRYPHFYEGTTQTVQPQHFAEDWVDFAHRRIMSLARQMKVAEAEPKAEGERKLEEASAGRGEPEVGPSALEVAPVSPEQAGGDVGVRIKDSSSCARRSSKTHQELTTSCSFEEILARRTKQPLLGLSEVQVLRILVQVNLEAVTWGFLGTLDGDIQILDARDEQTLLRESYLIPDRRPARAELLSYLRITDDSTSGFTTQSEDANVAIGSTTPTEVVEALCQRQFERWEKLEPGIAGTKEDFTKQLSDAHSRCLHDARRVLQVGLNPHKLKVDTSSPEYSVPQREDFEKHIRTVVQTNVNMGPWSWRNWFEDRRDAVLNALFGPSVKERAEVLSRIVGDPHPAKEGGSSAGGIMSGIFGTTRTSSSVLEGPGSKNYLTGIDEVVPDSKHLHSPHLKNGRNFRHDREHSSILRLSSKELRMRYGTDDRALLSWWMFFPVGPEAPKTSASPLLQGYLDKNGLQVVEQAPTRPESEATQSDESGTRPAEEVIADHDQGANVDRSLTVIQAINWPTAYYQTEAVSWIDVRDCLENAKYPLLSTAIEVVDPEECTQVYTGGLIEDEVIEGGVKSSGEGVGVAGKKPVADDIDKVNTPGTKGKAGSSKQGNTAKKPSVEEDDVEQRKLQVRTIFKVPVRDTPSVRGADVDVESAKNTVKTPNANGKHAAGAEEQEEDSWMKDDVHHAGSMRMEHSTRKVVAAAEDVLADALSSLSLSRWTDSRNWHDASSPGGLPRRKSSSSTVFEADKDDKVEDQKTKTGTPSSANTKLNGLGGLRKSRWDGAVNYDEFSSRVFQEAVAAKDAAHLIAGGMAAKATPSSTSRPKLSREQNDLLRDINVAHSEQAAAAALKKQREAPHQANVNRFSKMATFAKNNDLDTSSFLESEREIMSTSENPAIPGVRGSPQRHTGPRNPLNQIACLHGEPRLREFLFGKSVDQYVVARLKNRDFSGNDLRGSFPAADVKRAVDSASDDFFHPIPPRSNGRPSTSSSAKKIPSKKGACNIDIRQHPLLSLTSSEQRVEVEGKLVSNYYHEKIRQLEAVSRNHFDYVELIRGSLASSTESSPSSSSEMKGVERVVTRGARSNEDKKSTASSAGLSEARRTIMKILDGDLAGFFGEDINLHNAEQNILGTSVSRAKKSTSTSSDEKHASTGKDDARFNMQILAETLQGSRQHGGATVSVMELADKEILFQKNFARSHLTSTVIDPSRAMVDSLLSIFPPMSVEAHSVLSAALNAPEIRQRLRSGLLSLANYWMEPEVARVVLAAALEGCCSGLRMKQAADGDQDQAPPTSQRQEDEDGEGRQSRRPASSSNTGETSTSSDATGKGKGKGMTLMQQVESRLIELFGSEKGDGRFELEEQEVVVEDQRKNDQAGGTSIGSFRRFIPESRAPFAGIRVLDAHMPPVQPSPSADMTMNIHYRAGGVLVPDYIAGTSTLWPSKAAGAASSGSGSTTSGAASGGHGGEFPVNANGVADRSKAANTFQDDAEKKKESKEKKSVAETKRLEEAQAGHMEDVPPLLEVAYHRLHETKAGEALAVEILNHDDLVESAILDLFSLLRPPDAQNEGDIVRVINLDTLLELRKRIKRDKMKEKNTSGAAAGKTQEQVAEADGHSASEVRLEAIAGLAKALAAYFEGCNASWSKRINKVLSQTSGRNCRGEVEQNHEAQAHQLRRDHQQGSFTKAEVEDGEILLNVSSSTPLSGSANLLQQIESIRRRVKLLEALLGAEAAASAFHEGFAAVRDSRDALAAAADLLILEDVKEEQKRKNAVQSFLSSGLSALSAFGQHVRGAGAPVLEAIKRNENSGKNGGGKVRTVLSPAVEAAIFLGVVVPHMRASMNVVDNRSKHNDAHAEKDKGNSQSRNYREQEQDGTAAGAQRHRRRLVVNPKMLDGTALADTLVYVFERTVQMPKSGMWTRFFSQIVQRELASASGSGAQLPEQDESEKKTRGAHDKAGQELKGAGSLASMDPEEFLQMTSKASASASGALRRLRQSRLKRVNMLGEIRNSIAKEVEDLAKAEGREGDGLSSSSSNPRTSVRASSLRILDEVRATETQRMHFIDSVDAFLTMARTVAQSRRQMGTTVELFALFDSVAYEEKILLEEQHRVVLSKIASSGPETSNVKIQDTAEVGAHDEAGTNTKGLVQKKKSGVKVVTRSLAYESVFLDGKKGDENLQKDQNDQKAQGQETLGSSKREEVFAMRWQGTLRHSKSLLEYDARAPKIQLLDTQTKSILLNTIGDGHQRKGKEQEARQGSTSSKDDVAMSYTSADEQGDASQGAKPSGSASETSSSKTSCRSTGSGIPASIVQHKFAFATPTARRALDRYFEEGDYAFLGAIFETCNLRLDPAMGMPRLWSLVPDGLAFPDLDPEMQMQIFDYAWDFQESLQLVGLDYRESRLRSMKEEGKQAGHDAMKLDDAEKKQEDREKVVMISSVSDVNALIQIAARLTEYATVLFEARGDAALGYGREFMALHLRDWDEDRSTFVQSIFPQMAADVRRIFRLLGSPMCLRTTSYHEKKGHDQEDEEGGRSGALLHVTARQQRQRQNKEPPKTSARGYSSRDGSRSVVRTENKGQHGRSEKVKTLRIRRATRLQHACLPQHILNGLTAQWFSKPIAVRPKDVWLVWKRSVAIAHHFETQVMPNLILDHVTLSPWAMRQVERAYTMDVAILQLGADYLAPQDGHSLDSEAWTRRMAGTSLQEDKRSAESTSARGSATASTPPSVPPGWPAVSTVQICNAVPICINPRVEVHVVKVLPLTRRFQHRYGFHDYLQRVSAKTKTERGNGHKVKEKSNKNKPTKQIRKGETLAGPSSGQGKHVHLDDDSGGKKAKEAPESKNTKKRSSKKKGGAAAAASTSSSVFATHAGCFSCFAREENGLHVTHGGQKFITLLSSVKPLDLNARYGKPISSFADDRFIDLLLKEVTWRSLKPKPIRISSRPPPLGSKSNSKDGVNLRFLRSVFGPTVLREIRLRFKEFLTESTLGLDIISPPRTSTTSPSSLRSARLSEEETTTTGEKPDSQEDDDEHHMKNEKEMENEFLHKRTGKYDRGGLEQDTGDASVRAIERRKAIVDVLLSQGGLLKALELVGFRLDSRTDHDPGDHSEEEDGASRDREAESNSNHFLTQPWPDTGNDAFLPSTSQ